MKNMHYLITAHGNKNLWVYIYKNSFLLSYCLFGCFSGILAVRKQPNFQVLFGVLKDHRVMTLISLFPESRSTEYITPY